jgi:hypothetical protein
MHTTTNLDDIKKEIEDLGHTITNENYTNMKHQQARH